MHKPKNKWMIRRNNRWIDDRQQNKVVKHTDRWMDDL